MKIERNKILKQTIQLILVAFLAKGMGFIREVVLANYYGTSYVADVFVAVQNIPAVIFTVFGTAVTTGFIPLYTEIHTKKGQKDADKFANNVFNIFFVLSILLSLLGIVFSKQLVGIFAGGFTGDTYTLCNNFTKFVVPTSIAIILVYVYNAYLQINGIFNQNSLMNVPYNIALIICIALGAYTGNNYILAVGLLIASFSQLIYLKILMRRHTNFQHSKYIKFNDKMIIQMLILVGPMFISTGVNQINTIIDRTLASQLIEGSVSALNYSNEIIGIITQVVILSLTTVLYPTMTKLFANGEKEKECRFIEKYINIVSLLVFPLAILVFIFAREIVDILFRRGAFDDNTVIFVARALKIYALGIIGISFRDVLNKVFYAMKNTVTPMINGIIAVIVNIILNFILIKKYEYLGLAFATSFASTICTILLFAQMIKKLNKINLKLIIKETLKIILASAILGSISYACCCFDIIHNSILKCIIYGGVSIIGYIITLLLLKEKIFIETCKQIKIKFRRKEGR